MHDIHSYSNMYNAQYFVIYYKCKYLSRTQLRLSRFNQVFCFIYTKREHTIVLITSQLRISCIIYTYLNYIIKQNARDHSDSFKMLPMVTDNNNNGV